MTIRINETHKIDRPRETRAVALGNVIHKLKIGA